MDIPPPLTPSEESARPANLVDTDILCRRCGYNLRGLPENGRCPECAAPAEFSFFGDVLHYSDPRWVRRLGRGAGCILWGTFIAGVVGLLWKFAPQRMDPELAGLLRILGRLLSYYGIWALTAREPNGIGDDRYITARKLIRVTLLVALLGELLKLVVDVTLPATLLRVLGLCMITAGLLEVVGQIAMLLYLEKLALRMREYEHADRAHLLCWGYGGGLLVFLLAAVGGSFFLGRTPLGGSATALGCFMALIGLALLVFSGLYLKLLYQMRRAFLREAAMARENWAQADATPAGENRTAAANAEPGT